MGEVGPVGDTPQKEAAASAATNQNETNTTPIASSSSVPAPFPKPKPRRVVIPVDNLDSSERALNFYLSDCRIPTCDRVYLFHVVFFAPTSNIGGVSGLFHKEQLRRQLAQKQIHINALKKKLNSILELHEVSAQFIVRSGKSAGASIITFAREKRAHYIIMSCKQKPSWPLSMLGETSDHVIHNANKMVVTVVPPYNLRERRDSEVSVPGELLACGAKRSGKFFNWSIKPRSRINSVPAEIELAIVEDE